MTHFLKYILRSSVITGLLASSPSLFAEPEQTYNTYCGACHGPDGKGIPGVNPPLRKSEWIRGDIRRPIQIILHGVKGPINVSGQAYNSVMPPQGDALTDQQIAEIVTYIRSSWGLQQHGTDAQQVARQRKATKNRNDMWTPEELKKAYKLPWKRAKIQNLTFSLYKGKFTEMPNFDELHPDAVEEQKKGLIDASQSGLEKDFAMVWEGKVEVPSDGEVTFRLSADDEARVIVDGKETVSISSDGNIDLRKIGKIKLKKGFTPIRIEYLQKGGEHGISLGMSNPNNKGNNTLSTLEVRTWPDIPLVANKSPKIYRNFIKGQSPRSIGIGFPEGVSIAYNGDTLGLGMLWKDAFIDAGRHWTARGQGFQRPSGAGLVNTGDLPNIAILNKPKAKWPKKLQKDQLRFKGYKLDKDKNPTFIAKVGEAYVYDHFKAMGPSKLIRTVTISEPSKLPDNSFLKLSKPSQANKKQEQWHLSEELSLSAKGSQLDTGNDNILLLNLNSSSSTTLTYTWK